MPVLQNLFRTRFFPRRGATPFDQIVQVDNYNGFSTAPNLHETIIKFKAQLRQAALHDEFDNEDPVLQGKIKLFEEQRVVIYKAMSEFDGKGQEAVEGWFIQNNEVLTSFITNLNEIYALRTDFAKNQSAAWELVDALATIALLAGGSLLLGLVMAPALPAVIMAYKIPIGLGLKLCEMGWNLTDMQIRSAISDDFDSYEKTEPTAATLPSLAPGR